MNGNHISNIRTGKEDLRNLYKSLNATIMNIKYIWIPFVKRIRNVDINTKFEINVLFKNVLLHAYSSILLHSPH